MFVIVLLITTLLLFYVGFLKKLLTKILFIKSSIIDPMVIPKSVNYHFTRVCNYNCGFCFHTAKTSFMLNLADAEIGLRMLKNAGKKFLDINLENSVQE